MLLSGGSLGAINLPGIQFWSPLDEPSLRLWLDGTDSATVSETNGLLDTWTNKAPSQDDFIPVPNNAQAPPSVTPGGIVFNATSIYIPSRLGIAINPNLIIVVAGTILNAANGNTDQRIIGIGLPVNADGSIPSTPGSIQFSVTETQLSWRHDNGFASFDNDEGDGTRELLSGQRAIGNYSTGRAWRNGAELALGNSAGGPPSSTVDTIVIGRGLWRGTIEDILVFESNSDAIREKAQGYIAHKRGLTTDLETNHPYKNSPPLAS